ncbi:hypothetical protein C0995_012541 [Termitomyces sp. Mi166|nr:hypothetical protein C0995_012541 [Termitomyces sp. Mi166\
MTTWIGSKAQNCFHYVASFVNFFDLLQHASKAQMDSEYDLTKDYPAVPNGAYTAMPECEMSNQDAEKVYTEEELINNYGFELIDWDGFEAVPLVDVNDCVYAVLAGQPNDPKYLKAADDAFWPLLKREKRQTFNIGYTYGIGNQVPSKQDNKSYNAMLDRFIQNPAIQCLMTYGSASVQLWAPQLYGYMDTYLQWLYNKLKISELPLSSVFPSMAFNFGGKVRTIKHCDVMNLLFGWCSIIAPGQFNPDHSAKFILWEAKLII